jgi:hypothetical protein
VHGLSDWKEQDVRPILFKRNFTVGRYRKPALLKRTWRPHRGGGGPHGETTDEQTPDPAPPEGDFGMQFNSAANSQFLAVLDDF